MKPIFLVLSLLLSYTSVAQDEFAKFQSADQAQKWQKLTNGDPVERVDAALVSPYENSTTIWGRAQKSKNKFGKECMKTFPHVKFCKCMTEEGAEKVAFSTFVGYVLILTDDKYSVEALGYDESAIKRFKSARNKCSELLK